MKSKRRRKFALIGGALAVLLALVGSAYLTQYQRVGSSTTTTTGATSCASPLGGASILRTQLPAPSRFGGVTEFALPSPLRDPNAPIAASDGSVWFGEQSVPGLAHFFPTNRTLVEYAWPFPYSAPPSPGGICGNKTDIWGVQAWNGKIWASDPIGDQLVSMDPSSGMVSTLRIPTNSSFPYTITLGPNDTLWFTELYGSKIGEVFPNGTLHEFQLPGGISATPAQIVFENSSTGFYDDVGQGATRGGIYSFNPAHFAPNLVGGQKLNYPSSLTLTQDAVWVALHGSSSVASYNFATKTWSYYPTSPVDWNPTTLPYFVAANGSSVWVNEHFGNRIAHLDPIHQSLTEYSESKGAVNGSIIGNTLTFALGNDRAWFTAWTGNLLGYVDATYSPGFYTDVAQSTTLLIQSGHSASVDLLIHDPTYSGTVTLGFADSEALTSRPSNLSFSVPSTSLSLTGGGQTTSINVTISASLSISPGTYWAMLTATDGLTYKSSFLKIVVTR